MISSTLWTLLLIQIAMGGADTIFHHELTQRLAWRPEQARELQLHGWRNLIYAIVFIGIGLTQPHGIWAKVLMVLLGIEMIITLADFVEEDRTRMLPWTERILHTVLTLNYGLILALLLPVLADWAARPTDLPSADHGWLSVTFAMAAFGVTLSGLRDLAAAARCKRLVDDDPAPLAQLLPGKQAILVTGGTGFVGARLIPALVAGGHDVTLLVRDPAKAACMATPLRIITHLDQISETAHIDAIINLAGEPIANGLWTKAKKARIITSRLEMTRALNQLCVRLVHKPSVIISGSAIGYYGARDDTPCDEGVDSGADFCANVCSAWEAEADHAVALGIRVVKLRIGLVFGRGGGMLANLLTPFEFGLGGRMGNGKQVMSWIHRDDLVRLICFCIARQDIIGAVNAVAPNPVSNADFARTLGAALRRPAIIPIPALPLRVVARGLADELLLGGQNVLPVKAVFHGFVFSHSRLDAALAECVGANSPTSQPKIPALRQARLLH